MPPSSGVVSVTITRSDAISSRGWWAAAIACSAMRSTNAIAARNPRNRKSLCSAFANARQSGRSASAARTLVVVQRHAAMLARWRLRIR